MKKVLGYSSLLAALGSSMPLHALPYTAPETWGGDLMSRPRLTGDWGGVRDDLASEGVVLDADVYWMPQAITSGGRDNADSSWSNAILTLDVDTQKLGLWPGGFFKAQSVTSLGDTLLRESGAIVPANKAWKIPTTEPDTGLQEFTFTQFLSQQFGIVLGKINLTAPTDSLHGDYTTGFLNAGLNGPLALALVPLSAYGVGALYLPSHDVTVASMVVDPNGSIMDNELNDTFDDGVMAIGSADLKVKPWGLPGHQNLTLEWSNKDRTSLVQDPSNIARLLLTGKFPRLGEPGPVLIEILEAYTPDLLIPPVPLNEEKDTWAAVYGFEQFLWQPTGNPHQGIGMFFTAGIADEKTNPIRYSYSLGLVGKGVVPGRPRDDVGIGWSRIEFSDKFVPLLRDTFDLGLDHEDAVELYYNASLMPWLNVTPNIQFISPGLNKIVNASGVLENLDNTYIIGLRAGLRF